jgi:DNA-binding protein H-NS
MLLNTSKLKKLPLEQLYALYDQIEQLLIKNIESEKRKLDTRLAALRNGPIVKRTSVRRASGLKKGRRRKYPIVRPKYINPDNRSETWSGRGRRPRWVVAQLKAGKKLNDLLM